MVVLLSVIVVIVVTRFYGVSIAASFSLSWCTMVFTNAVVSIHDRFF